MKNRLEKVLNNPILVRKIEYALFGIGLVLLISGGFSSFLLGLKSDHSEVLRRMDDVSGVFESFSTNTTVFEEFRDELYNDVLGNVYYETMFLTDSTVKQKLKDYEKIVDLVEKDTKQMDKLCGNVYYPDVEANNKCMNYKSIYEQVVNYFITDIKIYNENVDKYNQYQESINSNMIVKKYNTNRKYIDYNGDKIFDGKEE